MRLARRKRERRNGSLHQGRSQSEPESQVGFALGGILIVTVGAPQLMAAVPETSAAVHSALSIGRPGGIGMTFPGMS